ncbi:hypothetical protein [Rhizomicrobium electricum]|uniref:Uncharacterized protein n=1 Tax=Rhizomicrobium electricum TaxID=480070 RepID=A0ABP3NYP1_9PROT|nr:hypothetical protein [Rhizomicrobium electricum]NIJ47335.1 hypothetical protein [Rhizomicrobium electricum]
MNLDEMLSQPLPEVPDNGFSDRVVLRVKAHERRKWIEIAMISVLAAAVACLLLPIRAIVGDFAASIILLGYSPTFGIGAAVLAATFLVDRLWSERQLLQF